MPGLELMDFPPTQASYFQRLALVAEVRRSNVPFPVGKTNGEKCLVGGSSVLMFIVRRSKELHIQRFCVA